MAVATSTLAQIGRRIRAGVLVVDDKFRIQLWNNWLALYSQKEEIGLLEQRIWEVFPEVPEKWFKRQVRAALLLNEPTFSHWRERPHVLKLPPSRAVMGGAKYMFQDCTFIPLPGDEDRNVCVTIVDVTEAALSTRKLEDALIRVEELSVRDGLTGLYNRRHLDQVMQTEFKRAKRYRSGLSLLIIDLDHFKSINDTYGHQAGDEVLIEVSERLQANTRDVDIVGRFGGEEMLILLPQVRVEGALIAAERLRRAIADRPFLTSAGELAVTTSIGVASYTGDSEDVDQLLRAADTALYDCKKKGRNCVVAGCTGKS